MKFLLFLGPGKTGSTFIYEYLKSHPKLCPSYLKETGYFLKPKGEYEKYYRKINENTEYCYEVSNIYFKSIAAVDNIDVAEYGEVELVIARRDPVDRALSHIRFLVRNGEDASNPAALIDAFPEVIESSRYKHYEKIWSDKFGQKLHFIEYKSKPEEFALELNGSLNILGLDSIEVKPELVNQSKAPRNKILTRYAKKLAVFIRSIRLLQLLQWCKDSPVVSKLFFEEKGAISVDRVSCEKEVRARLVELGELNADG